MNKKYAFTLLELIIVVIIMGILASIALPRFSKTREATLERNMAAVLKAIYAAEKVYYLDFGNYYPTSGSVDDLSEINSNLDIDLTDDPNWRVTIVTGATIMAQRYYGDIAGRILSINTYSSSPSVVYCEEFASNDECMAESY